MCSGPNSNGRPFPGGAVAIIHPKHEHNKPTQCFTGRVYFCTPSNERRGSSAVITFNTNKDNAKEYIPMKQLDVVIHNRGDLSSVGMDGEDTSFFKFSTACQNAECVVAPEDDSQILVIPLSPRLNLSIAFSGSDGIIGRKVSLLGNDGEVIGDGVIGWN